MDREYAVKCSLLQRVTCTSGSTSEARATCTSCSTYIRGMALHELGSVKHTLQCRYKEKESSDKKVAFAHTEHGHNVAVAVELSTSHHP